MSTNAFEFDDDYSQDAWTADSVNEEAWNDSKLEAQRKARAEAAGVQDARHVGYAEVLEVYNRRADTEPLADRRARALAVDAGQQDFTRAAEYTGNSETTETEYPADGGWSDRDFAPEVETEGEDGG